MTKDTIVEIPTGKDIIQSGEHSKKQMHTLVMKNAGKLTHQWKRPLLLSNTARAQRVKQESA